MDLIEFLEANRDHLKYSTIEKETGIYTGAIAKAVRGVDYRHLTDEQKKAIHGYIVKWQRCLKKYLDDN